MPDSNDVDTQVVAPGSDEDLIATRESLDDDLLSLDDEEPTKLREAEVPEQNELPDEIGDFDLDLDEAVEEIDEEMVDEDALSFDLPEDLDLSTEEDLPTSEQGTATDESLIPLDPTVEAPDLTHVPPMEEESDELEMDMDTSEFEEDLSELDDEVSLDFADEDSKSEEAVTTSDAKEVEETMAMSSVERAEQQVDREGTRHIEAALDMDISDLENAELHTGTFKAADDITEFSPAEITGEFTAFDVDAEDAVEEVDASAGLEKTGTYAPGDFDDEIDSVMSDAPEDDIEDLMLPDDVDEVATKLDLAKAFIDMGDAEGARSSLEEVIAEGTTEQKALATGLLEKIN
jgi:pilus assembly protein FimV